MPGEKSYMKLASLHDDIQKLTNDAFRECANEEEVISQGSMVNCICKKFQNDKWRNKILGY